MLHLENDKSTTHNGYSLFLSGDELDEVRPLFDGFPHVSSPFHLEFAVTRLADVCDILSDYDLMAASGQLNKRITQLKPATMELVDNPVLPKFKLAPHLYQKDAVKYGIEHPRFLLGDEMGLGKTGTMIFLAEILKAHYQFKHVLIVCGINGAKYNWHQVEIPKFSHEHSHIVGGRINSKGRFVVGGTQERLCDLQMPHDEFYLLINLESLRDEKISAQLQHMISTGEIGMVIIDEVHKASGATSAQGKAIHKLRPKFRVGLTGTPIHNKPFDLYNIMKWLGYEYQTFAEFRLEHAYEIPKSIIRGGREIKYSEYVYKDLATLHEKLKKFMLRRTVDVLQLPEPIFKDEYVELDKEQQKLYTKIREDIINSASYKSALSTSEVLSNPGVVFVKARQAVSAPAIFGIKSDAKLERTAEIVEEALDAGKSIVIFAWFNATIDSYTHYLRGKFGASKILAVQEDTKNAQDIVSEFQNNNEPQVLIGTIGKLGTSFTITRADIVIFVDKHVVWSDYKQAYMRVWRQGQTKNVVIINLMVKDTVDERLEYLIAKGKSHSQQVVDGVVDEVDEYIAERFNVGDLL